MHKVVLSVSPTRISHDFPANKNMLSFIPAFKISSYFRCSPVSDDILFTFFDVRNALTVPGEKNAKLNCLHDKKRFGEYIRIVQQHPFTDTVCTCYPLRLSKNSSESLCMLRTSSLMTVMYRPLRRAIFHKLWEPALLFRLPWHNRKPTDNQKTTTH